MSALIENLLVEQGVDFQRELTVTELDGSDIVNLAAFTNEGMVRDKYGKYITSFTIEVTSSKTILVSLPPAETRKLNVFKEFNYEYDVEGTSPSGIVYRFAQGKITSSAEQTYAEV